MPLYWAGDVGQTKTNDNKHLSCCQNNSFRKFAQNKKRITDLYIKFVIINDVNLVIVNVNTR